MRRAIAAASAALALWAAPAGAATILVTWHGEVLDGTDTLGTFGAVGASLAGQAFDAVYSFDTLKGAVLGEGHQIFGGTNRPLGSLARIFEGPGSATFTINGASVDIDGSADSFIVGATGIILLNSMNAVGHTLFMVVISPLAAPDLFSSYEKADVCAGATSCSGSLTLDGPLMHLRPGSLRLDAPADWYMGDVALAHVPEPGVWGLMIVGLGLAGGALRRARPRPA